MFVTFGALDQICWEEQQQVNAVSAGSAAIRVLTLAAVTRQKMSRGLGSVAALAHVADDPLLTAVSVGYGGVRQEQREAVGPITGRLLQRRSSNSFIQKFRFNSDFTEGTKATHRM